MIVHARDERLMLAALDEARTAGAAGEVPVGAVIADGDTILVRTHNRMRETGDPTAHAELLAIREVAARGELSHERLAALTLVVTLEPCAMCAGAIVLSRVGRLVFGAWDGKAGMCGSVGDVVRHPKLNHRPEVLGGVLGDSSARLLREFFATRRATADAP